MPVGGPGVVQRRSPNRLLALSGEPSDIRIGPATVPLTTTASRGPAVRPDRSTPSTAPPVSGMLHALDVPLRAPWARDWRQPTPTTEVPIQVLPR